MKRQTTANVFDTNSVTESDGRSVFEEPWQAQIFALVVQLNESGFFAWKEWAEALGEEKKKAGRSASGTDDYLNWLQALEKLLDKKGITSPAERADRETDWRNAADATPHGEPIELS